MFRRQQLVMVCLAVGWLILAGRLIQIQLLDRDRFADRAARQRLVEQTVPARPGDILDRHGRLLATTIQSQSLFVDPALLSDISAVAAKIARALGMNGQELEQRLLAGRERRFVWIKRRLTPEEVDAVRALDLPEGTWGFRQEYRRHYPQGTLAAHVLGLRDIDGVGRGGVEEWFDAHLRGRDGCRRVVRDARGYVIDVLDEVTEPAIPGQPIVLTIDSVIQLSTERELDAVMEARQPTSACAIVLDPRTGEILALASRPAFDPNSPETIPEEAWTNTALTAMFEPGSTFKPCVVAWALDQGVIDPGEQFDCENGSYRMGRRILHDHHPYGTLDVAGILVKSSNIGMAKIGERLGNERLHEAAAAFGFGSRTGIELPGERPGMLRPLDEWTSYSTGSIPMGQELAATPLQVIAAIGALANRGRRIAPHLLHESTWPDGVRNVVVSPVVSEDTARWLVETALVSVVEHGTGQHARIPGVRVFGKSGTAQKFDPETGQYSATRHVSSFVCGAPAEYPRVLVLVSVNEPDEKGSQFGGTVAGPVAAAILKQTLTHLDGELPAARRADTLAR